MRRGIGRNLWLELKVRRCVREVRSVADDGPA